MLHILRNVNFLALEGSRMLLITFGAEIHSRAGPSGVDSVEREKHPSLPQGCSCRVLLTWFVVFGNPRRAKLTAARITLPSNGEAVSYVAVFDVAAFAKRFWRHVPYCRHYQNMCVYTWESGK